MATMQETATVIAVFDSPEQASQAVRALVDAGVDREDISLVSRNREASTTGKSTETGTKKTADGTTVGENIAGGAVFGGLGGLLLGLGALAIPGVGPIVAAGPIATTLAGAGIGAAGGGIIGAIKDAGVPDEDAHVYAESVRRGGTMVSVRTDDLSRDRVADILDDHGAVDVDERAASYRSSGWSRFDENADEYKQDEYKNYNDPNEPITMEKEAERAGIQTLGLSDPGTLGTGSGTGSSYRTGTSTGTGTGTGGVQPRTTSPGTTRGADTGMGIGPHTSTPSGIQTSGIDNPVVARRRARAFPRP
jgi:uncharacterized membrane protein